METDRAALFSELRHRTSRIREMLDGYDIITIRSGLNRKSTLQLVNDQEDRIFTRRVKEKRRPPGRTVGWKRSRNRNHQYSHSWTITNLSERRKYDRGFRRFTPRKNLDEALKENQRLIFRLSTQQKVIETCLDTINHLRSELLHEKLRPGGSEFKKALQRNLDKMKP